MWYAIRTEPGREEVVKRLISRRTFQAGIDDCRILYCIRKKRYLGAWHEEREYLLPGYLFLVIEEVPSEPEDTHKLSKDREDFPWQPVLNEATEGIISVFPVGYEEERFLKKLTGGKNEIGMSYGVIRDGILKIRSGGLVGMESRVRKIDRHKRKGCISMKLHGKETIAELGLEITEKTSSLPYECISGKAANHREDVPRNGQT